MTDCLCSLCLAISYPGKPGKGCELFFTTSSSKFSPTQLAIQLKQPIQELHSQYTKHVKAIPTTAVPGIASVRKTTTFSSQGGEGRSKYYSSRLYSLLERACHQKPKFSRLSAIGHLIHLINSGWRTLA